MKSIAIVTGAGGGFGKELVKLLVKETDVEEIWAIARKQETLEALKEELGEKICVLPMDLTDREKFREIRALLETSDVSVKYLVNNAGFAKFGSYADVSSDVSLNMIDLNVGAVVALSQICIPHMSKGSRIINVSSQASFFPLPYMNTYASTKAFVTHYTRALNVELKEKGISATTVCPGWMSTDLFGRAEIGAKKGVNNFFGIKAPEVVASRAFRDAKRGKALSTYGFYVKSTHILSKILPRKITMKFWLIQQGIK